MQLSIYRSNIALLMSSVIDGWGGRCVKCPSTIGGWWCGGVRVVISLCCSVMKSVEEMTPEKSHHHARSSILFGRVCFLAFRFCPVNTSDKLAKK